MNDALRNNKAYNKSNKIYFPCRSTVKTQPKKRKKKNKWINLESSFKSCKSERNSVDLIIDDTFKEDTIEESKYVRTSQEAENSPRLSPILKYSNFEKKSPIIGTSISKCKKDNLIQDEVALDSKLLNIEWDEESLGSYVIDEFLTQDCTTLGEHSEKENVQKYHYKKPAKCKKLDKNGLAFGLQSALSKQNAEVTFWKHKREFTKDIILDEDLSTLFVQVKNSYKQFGVSVLECEDLNKGENCLLMVGFTHADYFCININSKIKIYQPYLMKHIKYKDNFMCCYFNISKIINL